MLDTHPFEPTERLLEIRNYGGALGLSSAPHALRERGRGCSLGNTITISSPIFTGAASAIPHDTVIQDYFKITEVSKWRMEDFIIVTGLDGDRFLSDLRDIRRIHHLPPEIGNFAGVLIDYYDGVLKEIIAEIAKDNAH
ncbi:hypothetical protein BGZ76_002108, partial [Entomortierella beljakovae]